MPNDRLDSWKEIAEYLKRGVRTVQRWERVAGLPVRRVPSGRGAVYAFRAELDSWWRAQSPLTLTRAEPSPPPSGAVRATTAPPVIVATPDEASTPQGSMRVRSFISQTVGIDPDSALAQAHLGVYFFTLVVVGLWTPAAGIEAARAAAARALEIDPASAEAHAVLGIVAGVHQHEWADAAQRFDRARAGAAVSPLVRFHHATWHLSPLEQHDTAIAEITLALRADPLYLLGRLHLALELQSVGAADEGLAELEQVARIDPQFGPAIGHLGRELAMRGRVAEAWPLAERTHTAAPRHPNAVGFIAGMLRQRGDIAASEQVMAELGRRAAWALPRARAEAAVVSGEPTAAIEALAEADEAGDPGVWLLLSGTAGTILRSMPGWRALRAQLNLPG